MINRYFDFLVVRGWGMREGNGWGITEKEFKNSYCCLSVIINY